MFTYHVLNQRTISTFPFIKFANIQANISFFATTVIPIIYIYRIQNQIGSNIMFHIKGHRGTSSTIIFIKHVTIQAKISFLRKGHCNTFILPNTKPNTFTYHIVNQGAHLTFPFIKFTKQAKITFSRHGTFQYFHFTIYKTKYVYVSRFK